MRVSNKGEKTLIALQQKLAHMTKVSIRVDRFAISSLRVLDWCSIEVHFSPVMIHVSLSWRFSVMSLAKNARLLTLLSIIG
jgi:hypothetical protein